MIVGTVHQHTAQAGDAHLSEGFLLDGGSTAHELMAHSGHKTLSEAQLYTVAANSGAAKMREALAKAPRRLTDQRDAGSEAERTAYKRGDPKSTNAG